ncbi:hypothetical protein MHYP_G00103530 [Metynnis hypsauchen]
MDEAGMTEKTLLIFILFLISGGGESKTVTGYSVGGVFIKCRYETNYTSNQKYLCKALSPNCSDQIRTGVKNEWINRGRFSLFDDTRAAQIWVLIRKLTVEDSGLYQCGVDRKEQQDVQTPVELKVEEDQVYEKSISVTGAVGGRVNISCNYSKSHSSDPKFLCRMMGTVSCAYKSTVKESRRWINEGKLHLHDDGKQIFTVSFNSLTEGDSGEYWCGAESDWTSDNGYKVYITQINLTVPDSPPPAFPVSSVVTGVSVVVLLLLIGLLFFIVTLRKRNTTQGPASTQSQSHRGSSDKHTDICSTAQSPTVLSDSPASATQRSSGTSAEGPTYATVNFSENADSSTDAVTTATINKEINSCDYATVKY